MPQPGTGRLTTIPFLLSGDIAGGSATSELRAYGLIDRPFLIRQIEIIPISSIELGQILDIIIAPDADAADQVTPSGGSIFPRVAGGATIPTPDNETGLFVPTQPTRLDMSYFVNEAQRGIKVQTRRTAGALSLPNVAIAITIEDFDVPPIPITPRPPLIPTSPTTTSTIIPQITSTGTGYAQAWRVAAQGLVPWSQVTSALGTYSMLDAYNAWQLDPTSERAAPFADRVQRVMDAAGVTDPNAAVKLTYAIKPGT